jgi:hypothetical protein
MSRTVVWTFLESPLIPVEASNRHSGEKAVVVAVRVPGDITWKVNADGSPNLWQWPVGARAFGATEGLPSVARMRTVTIPDIRDLA